MTLRAAAPALPRFDEVFVPGHALRSACALGLAIGLGLVLAPAARARTFEAEGADTGAGLGARYIALGGTGVASSDDVYSVYYNPAGLAEASGFELSVSRQLNATLHPVNFVGGAWQLPLGANAGVRATLGAAYYPRIHARASGAFADSDFESVFLRYLLPGISGTFDGDIDTKTKSYRLALGMAPADGAAWSAGVYVEKIDCRSNFCGVHATSNGYATQSTGATATGVGFGLRWRPSVGWTLGASVSDLHTRLTVNSVTTDAAGTRSQQTSAQFPRKLAGGAAWQLASDTRLFADYEMMKGRYGRSEIDLQLFRLGGEKRIGVWAWRGGAVVPTRVYSSASGTLKTPFPFSPTLGIGWRGDALKIDFAVYAHAVMSMYKDAISPAADLSLSLAF